MWNEAEILIPYGQENPEPVVLVKGCTLGQLEERFSIDNRSLPVPTREVYDIAVQVKGSNLIKVLDFRISETEGL
jgi:hypothetical protein